MRVSKRWRRETKRIYESKHAAYASIFFIFEFISRVIFHSLVMYILSLHVTVRLHSAHIVVCMVSWSRQFWFFNDVSPFPLFSVSPFEKSNYVELTCLVLAQRERWSETVHNSILANIAWYYSFFTLRPLVPFIRRFFFCTFVNPFIFGFILLSLLYISFVKGRLPLLCWLFFGFDYLRVR